MASIKSVEKEEPPTKLKDTVKYKEEPVEMENGGPNTNSTLLSEGKEQKNIKYSRITTYYKSITTKIKKDPKYCAIIVILIIALLTVSGILVGLGYKLMENSQKFNLMKQQALKDNINIQNKMDSIDKVQNDSKMKFTLPDNNTDLGKKDQNYSKMKFTLPDNNTDLGKKTLFEEDNKTSDDELPPYSYCNLDEGYLMDDDRGERFRWGSKKFCSKNGFEIPKPGLYKLSGKIQMEHFKGKNSINVYATTKDDKKITLKRIDSDSATITFDFERELKKGDSINIESPDAQNLRKGKYDSHLTIKYIEKASK